MQQTFTEAYCVPGTVLSIENIAMNKTDKDPSLYVVHITGWGDR